MLLPILSSQTTLPLPTRKSTTSWAGATKNTSQWTNTAKGSLVWRSIVTLPVPYLYDDAAITYDNAYTYDYLSQIPNQENTKNSTQWSTD